MPTTSPDNLWSPDNSDNFEDLVPDLATMQGSVQAALSSRAIRTYKWADTAARNAQTGMSEGDLGHQMDSDVYYTYSGSAWGLLLGSPQIGSVTAGPNFTISSTNFLHRVGRVVTVTIAASTTSAISTGAILGTVPEAFRPLATVPLSTIVTSTGNPAYGHIQFGGQISVRSSISSDLTSGRGWAVTGSYILPV